MSNLDLSSRNISDNDQIFFKINNPENFIFIDLSKNNLTSLPNDLSAFQNLQNLDLSDNPFINYQNVGLSLSTIPNLEILKIDLSTQENAYFILSQLPNLKYLNEKPVKEEEKSPIDINDKEADNSSLKNEIPNFNSITQRITNKLNQKKQSTDLFYSEFQKVLKEQIEKINNLDENIPNYIYTAYVYQAKLEIYFYLQNKCLSMLSGKSDFDIINILKDINNFIKNNYNETIILIQKIGPKFEEVISSFQNSLKEKDNQIEELNNNLEQIQIELNNKDNYTNQIIEENKILKDRCSELRDNNNPTYINNNDNINNNNNNNNINNINKNRIININNNFSPNPNIQNVNNKEANLLIKNLQIENPKVSKKNENMKKYISKGNNNNKTKKTEKENPTITYQQSTSNISQANQKDNKIMIGPINKRNLTLKTLLEMINEIYNSKFQRDKQLMSSHLQKETLEQHMYSYFNKKYGLKNLIIEYASAIISGIKKFSKENSEVCLFGKILRNELEEEEILIVSKLKSAINQFLNLYYQNKFPLKNKNDIEIMVNKIKLGNLNEELWSNIINYIFSSNENDLINLNDKIQNYINKNNIQDNSISYQKFIQIVIDFQIRVRENYLKNFNELFKQVDLDRNGILSENEFIKLIELMNIYQNQDDFENQIQNFINQLDPFQTKIFIYSDIINCLSKEIIEEQDNETGEIIQMSILDRISIQMDV